jgi:hypothetical protein
MAGEVSKHRTPRNGRSSRVICSNESVMAASGAMRSYHDKTRPSVRPDKSEKKKCLDNIESGIKPGFSEESNISQVTFVGTVNLSRRSLPRLILTTADIRFNAETWTYFKNSYSTFKTPEGSMNRDGMSYYIETILVPASTQARKHFAGLNLAFWLILHNHGSHDRQELIAMFRAADV